LTVVVKLWYGMRMSMTVLQLADRLRTEADAYLLLEELRWHGRPVCPHCGSIGEHYFLKPSNGSSRKTRTGAASERRVWKCRDCRKQFSVLTGTIFHGTKIPIRTWLMVIFDASAAKNGISAREIERRYGVTPRTAWHLMHRLREAMKLEPIAGLLSGIVIADETWYGGKPSNRHGHKRAKAKRLQGQTDKTPIFALVSRQTGEVRSQAVPNVRGDNLRKVIERHVDAPRTHLHTDSGLHYRELAKPFAMHSTVDHSAGEYVSPGGTTTNRAETYFSQLKRSLDGTHHHVSVEHLHRYLAEFDYRYTTCKLSDTERMERLIGKVAGRRLLYSSSTCG
jgi:transposase-like protein